MRTCPNSRQRPGPMTDVAWTSHSRVAKSATCSSRGLPHALAWPWRKSHPRVAAVTFEPRPDHLEPGGHALEVVGRPEHEVLGGCDGGEVIDVGTIAQKEDGAGVAAPQHEGG